MPSCTVLLSARLDLAWREAAIGEGTITTTTDHQLEVLTWEGFGAASRELAVKVATDGYRPDLILAITAAVFR